MCQLCQIQQFEQSSQRALSGWLPFKGKAMIGLGSNKNVIANGHPKKEAILNICDSTWVYLYPVCLDTMISIQSFASYSHFHIMTKQNWPSKKENTLLHFFRIKFHSRTSLFPTKEIALLLIIQKTAFPPNHFTLWIRPEYK